MGQDLDRTEQSMRRLESRAGGLEQQTRKARLEFGALGKVLGLLKWPALIAGVGGAIQALGGLTAGAVALLPKILDLAGAGSAFGVTMIGAGAAMGVAKFATQGLSRALAGNKAALRALTPEGRSFLQMLRAMRPELQSLRQAAQRGLFPGVGDLLGSLKSQAPALRAIVSQTAGDLGGLARFGGQQLSSPGFMKDLASLADQSGRAFGAAGRGVFYLGQALEQVLLAAAPLTDWLGSAFVRLGKLADQEALVGRATGGLGDFFDRTRQSISTMGDVGKHVFDGLRGLMDAARGQSDSLWGSIDRVATRFDHWTNSLTGQDKLRAWFDQMRPVLSEAAGLVGAVGKAVASLTQGPAGAQMLQALRNAMPAITSGLASLTSTLGPAVVSAFGSVVHLFGDMAGQAGPLTLVARSIGLVAQAADALVHALGPLGPAIGTAVLSFGLLKRMGAFSAVDALRSTFTGAAAGAGAAGAGAAGAGVASSGATTAEALAGGALAARVVAGGERVLPSGIILPAGVTAAEETASAGLLARGGSLLAGGARVAMGAASKFVLPLMALQGLFGALGTQGNVGDRVLGGFNAATFGLGGKALNVLTAGVLGSGSVSAAQRQTAGGRYAQNIISGLSNDPSVAGQRRTIGGLRNALMLLPGNDAFDQNTADLRTATQALQKELDRRRAILAASVAATNRQLDRTSILHAQNLVQQFTNVFGILKGPLGPEAAMKQSVDGALTSMRHMRPAGAQILDESMLDWAHQQARANPRLKGQFDRLVAGIKSDFSDLHKHVQIVNGQILTGSQKEWQAIRDALTTPVEQAREAVSRGFTAIQQEAIGSLQAMGYNRSQAMALVGNITSKSQGAKNINATGFGAQHGGKYARGGRLPGTGTLDTVPMVDGGFGAPGELVVNRWTERDVNRDLSMAGKPSLEQRVRNETRPHYAVSGRIGPANAGPVAQSHPELHAGIAAAVQAVLSHFPLQITSTTGGGHATNSYHYRGEAADLAGPASTMLAAANWINANLAGGLTEGIHNPNLSVKYGHAVPSSYWGSTVWGQHANHIHLAVAGALNAAGLAGGGARGPIGAMLLGALRVPGTSLGGVPGAMVTQAQRMYAGGLRQAINRHLGSYPAAGGSGGTSGANQALGRAMMLAAGWGADQWPALQALWTQESGWNANAVNASSGAYGIPQALGHGHPFALGDPRGQIAWGLNYIRGRYGSPSAAEAHERAFNWYAKGGRLGAPAWGGWHATGTDMTVTRPTLFGAGDAGPERVRITPQHGGRASVSVSGTRVSVGGGISERRVHQLLDRRLREFAEDVADEIEAGAEEPTAGAIR